MPPTRTRGRAASVARVIAAAALGTLAAAVAPSAARAQVPGSAPPSPAPPSTGSPTPTPSTPSAPTPTLPAPGAPAAPNSSPSSPNVPGSSTGTPGSNVPGAPGAPVTPGSVRAPRTPADAGQAGAATLSPTPVGPLSLGGAARLAAVQSASSEEARARIDQARGRLRQSQSALLPSLTGLGSQNQRTFNTASFGITFPSMPGQPPLFDPNGQVAGPVNIYDFRARLASTLLDLSARERVRASRTLVRAGTADAENQGQIAAASAAITYLRVLQSESQLDNRVADSVLAAELLTIARQQLLAGTGVALDVTRAATQLAGTRASLIAARNTRDRARLDLNRAVGVTLDQPLTLTDRLTTLPLDTTAPDVAAAERVARTRRADIRVAAEQATAAQQSARAIRAARYPSLQAFADDGNTGLGFTRGRLLNTYTYGVQVSVPFYTGGLQQGREQEQQAAATELNVRAQDLQTQASVDVRGALLDLRSAREEVAAAREQLTLAEQEVTQARDRFRAGVAGNADVITASQTLTAARTTYVDALTSFQNARVALARAQGTVVDLP